MAENQTKPAAPDQGDFMDVPFPRLFNRYIAEKRTGLLDVRDKRDTERGRLIKRLAMIEGAQFAVFGGGVKETLLEILLERKKIDPAKYEAIKAEHGGDYNQIETKILFSGVVPPHEISDLVGFQTTLKIKNLFPLVRGHFQFKPEPAADVLKTCKGAVIPLAPDKVIFEGVSQFYPETRVKKEMPLLEKKVFVRKPGGFDRIGAFGLAPEVQRWIRALPEKFNLSSIVRGAPVKEPQVLAIFLSLYFMDLIAMVDPETFPFGRAYLDAEEEKKLAPKVVEQKAAPEKVEVKPAEEPKLPIEAMLDRELSDQEIVVEIDKLLKIAADREKTYFDLLGLDEKTSLKKIKIIYFKFARKFHPDSRHSVFVGGLRVKVETLFAKVTEAYDTLNDQTLRAEYIKRLKSKVSAAEMELAQRAVEAEMEFQKADVLIKRNAFAQALGPIERAIKLQPEEPEYKMYLGWVEYKLKGPGEAARAKKLIREVLEKRPTAVDGHLFLGMIAKAEGDIDEAERHFLKVATARPHDIEVKRELQQINKKKFTPPPRKGGFFGKKG